MITANNMLRNAFSHAGNHLPKARQQLRQLKANIQTHITPVSLSFWRQRSRSPAPALSFATRPLCTTTIRWMAAPCNDALFTPPPATQPQAVRNGPRALRTIQLIDHQAPHQPLVRLRLSGRMSDVCEELDRLVALEGSR